MENKKSINRTLLAIVLFVILTVGAAAGAFFGLRWYFTNQNQPEKIIETKSVQPQVINDVATGEIPETEWAVPPNDPKYFSIPSINIMNARVENLGVKSGTERQFDDPKYSMDVGWYRDSIRPGSGSDAGLYDGHFGVGNYQAAFTNLAQVNVGDEIIIERGDGVKFSYSVVENKTVPISEVNMEELMRSADPDLEGISLITCAGNWDATSQTYNQRTIVRAVII